MKNYKGDEHLSLQNIPSWVPAKIGDICEPVNGKAFKSSDWKKEGLPIIRIKNLKNAETPFNYYQGELEEKFKVYDGDLLFAWSGTPGTSFGAHIWKGNNAVLNQHIFNIRFNKDFINPKFFCFALNHNVARYIEQAQGGVGLAHITKSKFNSSYIPLPPLNEQNRIVKKIDELFSKLDAGIEALKQVQTLLKRYRQSVLKSAVEGKLTSEWRKKHKNELEPAEKLLERLLKERKEKWEAEQLANYKAERKKLPKDWQKRYIEPKQPDTSDLPELPDGWVWVSLESIADVIDPNPSHRMPKYINNGIPFISTENFTDNDGIDFTIGKKVSKITLKEQIERFSITQGDFVLSRIGTIGKTRLLPKERDYCLSHALVVIKTASDGIDSKYLRYLLSSDYVLLQAKKGVQSVGVPDLGMGKIRSFVLPIMSIQEQQNIVRNIENIFSIINKLEIITDTEIKRSQSLRQSILKHAFEGKLVPQNPNDEPASVLLEKIKAEKSKAKKTKQ